MYAGDTQVATSQGLQAFHRDAADLFLGSAFTTVGLVAICFSFLGRKLNTLLLWFALFAILYGQRLWLDTGLVHMIVPYSNFFERFKESVNYLVPIPAFFYFEEAEYTGRIGKQVVWAITAVFLCFFAATLLLGPHRLFGWINNVIVTTALMAMVVQSLRTKSVSRDSVLIRRGLYVFAAFAIGSNLANAFTIYPNVEAWGFAYFLATLGYVAARQTLHRDQQFSELQKELDVARRIQMGNLPAAYPNSRCFEVATRYIPMTAVAGDIYDFVVADEHQAGLLVADVSGHGVPAALIASMVKFAAISQRANATDPAALLTGMNAALCGNTQEQFVTAAYAHIDAATGILRYAAAAHPPLLLVRDGAVLEITENGLLLAAFSFATFRSASHDLKPGDRLVLYTDGIIEAANARQEEFGQTRLQTVLKEAAGLPPQIAADRIIASVQAWSKQQDDDLTIVICDYAGI